MDAEGRCLSTEEWLRSLAAAGVTEIGIAMPDLSRPPADDGAAWHLRAAYVGGLPVALQVGTPPAATAWAAHWLAAQPTEPPRTAGPTEHDGSDSDRPDGDRPDSDRPDSDHGDAVGGRAARARKPWQVTYRAMPTDLPLDRPAVDEARDDLVEALLAATQFARTHAMEPWDMTFEQARVTGLSGDPQPHGDTMPFADLPLEQRQLWAMAAGAEVFGGMGSWNDMSFDDPAAQRGYDDTSSTLYAAIMRAFRACVNNA